MYIIYIHVFMYSSPTQQIEWQPIFIIFYFKSDFTLEFLLAYKRAIDLPLM